MTVLCRRCWLGNRPGAWLAATLLTAGVCFDVGNGQAMLFHEVTNLRDDAGRLLSGERFGLGLQPGDFCLYVFERSHSFLFLYVLKSVEFSTKFPSLNLPFVRTDPFFNKPFPFIGLALGGVFGRDGLHEPVDHIGFDQIVRESGMLVVDSFD